jgi:transposase
MTSRTPILPSANLLVSGRLVAGVDTHKNIDLVAVVDHLGRLIADRQFPTTGRGDQEVINFFDAHGHFDRVGVEGTGSYGAGRARELTVPSFTVVEIIRQNWQARRLRGKSDPIDAHQASLALLSGADTVPKTADGQVESLRILLTERRFGPKPKSQTIRRIRALLVTAPEPVRDTYRALGSTKIVKTLARTRPTGSGFNPNLVTRQTLKRLAVRYLILHEEIDEIAKQLDPLARAVNPTLLSLSGIGLVTAAALLVAAGDNPERLATRATFAALAGVAPQPASRGQRTRHRLSRG